ncbi:MAG TPA: PilN domain-containing protein [Verrucomicrobiae bacterium]|nr:PilN domain-containing protein [Verrucomicrobiae bacterium]
MIRINLLGQARPKAAKQAVPLESTLQVVLGVAAIAVALVVLSVVYFSQKRQLEDTTRKIQQLQAEKAGLQQIKQDVDRFENQKTVLQQRIDMIETLQKNRSGGQDLLRMVANTVVRVDSVWLTSMSRTAGALEIDGEAGSINSVANFITELKRSGYFDKIEIKDAKENDLVPGVETYSFSMTAAVAGASGAPKAETTAATGAARPAAKGRS